MRRLDPSEAIFNRFYAPNRFRERMHAARWDMSASSALFCAFGAVSAQGFAVPFRSAEVAAEAAAAATREMPAPVWVGGSGSGSGTGYGRGNGTGTWTRGVGGGGSGAGGGGGWYQASGSTRRTCAGSVQAAGRALNDGGSTEASTLQAAHPAAIHGAISAKLPASKGGISGLSVIDSVKERLRQRQAMLAMASMRV